MTPHEELVRFYEGLPQAAVDDLRKRWRPRGGDAALAAFLFPTAGVTLYKRGEALTQHTGDGTMTPVKKYSKYEYEPRKSRRAREEAEELEAQLAKLATAGANARAAPAAPPPVDVSELGVRTARVIVEGGATERMLDPSLTREQGIAKYLATPGGRMMHQFNLDARRRGEAGIPAEEPVAKAAPNALDPELKKSLEADAALLAEIDKRGGMRVDKEPIEKRMYDLIKRTRH